MTTYMTTYPTLRQRIRLADAIELAGDADIPADPPAGPRYAEPDPDE